MIRGVREPGEGRRSGRRFPQPGDVLRPKRGRALSLWLVTRILPETPDLEEGVEMLALAHDDAFFPGMGPPGAVHEASTRWARDYTKRWGG